MTKEEAKKLLPILQAWVGNKTIQQEVVVNQDRGELDWEDTSETWLDVNYPNRLRIKPEPKYRPFKDAEECWQEMQKHPPFGWIKAGSDYMNISNISNDDVISYNGSDYPEIISFSHLKSKNHSKITFVDGTPFGIKEEN